MPDTQHSPSWDLNDAIRLLNSLKLKNSDSAVSHEVVIYASKDGGADDTCEGSLGDFSSLWDYLGRPHAADEQQAAELFKYEINDEPVAEVDLNQLSKAVRWRDELDGADLEDNVEAPNNKATAAYIRNQKRAARRARAKERAEKPVAQEKPISDTTDLESGEELESLRRSPDRRAVIDSILGRNRPGFRDNSSPPTSPSPPKAEIRTPQRDFVVSNPFVWPATPVSTPSKNIVITPRDGLTARTRKQALITELMRRHPEEQTYLTNPGLLEPAFSPLNTSSIGIHVFVDISNISIGFHDCLKLARGMPRETRLKRVPLSFHNFSLILERGRPCAKRVLVGSDKYAAIQQAKSIGYETNILERVHKAKELTPRQKKYQSRSGGETSGSETNTGLSKHSGSEKWVEQAVDEILHLKILESIIDSQKPSTIVLATGDAAEAEYSGGFLRMVERALEKQWRVELVSFRLNTSSLYKRREFRVRWGQLFKCIELDPFVEFLIDEENDG
ncbi:NYN domain-containing protein [Cladophialophora immunda]|nr:NYN domain-containing protein [Cladophialophora immunda]